ncbi:1,2-phenylacetyl-CoA epoxidase subunit PaaD [Pararobbsia silviterrae]|uniref:Phenylacetate-CoA oxygenase subunit PaaJ n=1 Tax=Pararobbsia silviterrae TaxID=1792498 RepID=A0A494Y3L5_9BURK|nr:1,2-phenylacetyl-CoA epoxidase subunit PaaD [Pararobbsia silviterrae]RKP56043.1 phenylacetate-CoA oxygenase subunit PaaJ [Pararobbsia silviterrae]
MTIRNEGCIDPAQVARIIDTVLDPEIPVVSIRELGIVRDLQCTHDHVDIVLTPTYSGCPATEAIEAAVREAFADAGYSNVTVRYRLAPAWTTDWITDEGRRKLHAYGIAPPVRRAADEAARHERPIRFFDRRADASVPCPQCGSAQTERLSAFGSTACKSLYRCRACGEPFDYFKPI